jgi:peptide subunit release factor 1 (eRF1)
MLKGRVKQKAKSKARSRAKSRVKGAVREHGVDHKLLKTAAVGGTAYYAGKKISEKGQEDQANSYGSPPAPEPGDSGSDMVTKLEKLAQLHESGILTDEEFAAAKQKVLAGG